MNSSDLHGYATTLISGMTATFIETAQCQATTKWIDIRKFETKWKPKERREESHVTSPKEKVLSQNKNKGLDEGKRGS